MLHSQIADAVSARIPEAVQFNADAGHWTNVETGLVFPPSAILGQIMIRMASITPFDLGDALAVESILRAYRGFSKAKAVSA